jgi:hypothetical protein
MKVSTAVVVTNAALLDRHLIFPNVWDVPVRKPACLMDDDVPIEWQLPRLPRPPVLKSNCQYELNELKQLN